MEMAKYGSIRRIRRQLNSTSTSSRGRDLKYLVEIAKHEVSYAQLINTSTSPYSEELKDSTVLCLL
jgi:hypothetical protein